MSEVTPWVEWHMSDPGQVVYLRLVALQKALDPPDKGKVIRTVRFDLFDVPIQRFVRIPVRPPLAVHKGNAYAFVIETRDPAVQLSIGDVLRQSLYQDGVGWYYTRLTGGNGEILDNNHGWHTLNNDLSFALTLVPLSRQSD